MSLLTWIVITTLAWHCLNGVVSSSYYNLEVGDPCPTREYHSSCQPAEQCATVMQLMKDGKLQQESVINCGYTTRGEKICCPIETASKATTTTTTTRKTTTTTTATTTTKTPCFLSNSKTTRRTPTESPPWLSIFNTNQEFLQPSGSHKLNRGGIIFKDESTSIGAGCQTPLYEGKCLGISKCSSIQTLLEQQRLQDNDIQTCRDGTTEEIICCPINVPLQPRGQVDTDTRVNVDVLVAGSAAAATTNLTDESYDKALELLPHYTHLAALAYLNAAADGYLHRCTAVALTSQLLLSAAGCERPNHAVFGVADMRDVDDEEDYLVDITDVAQLRQDWALLRLKQPLQLGQNSVANVSLAPMCTHFEQNRLQVSGKLVATAWAKGNGSDCLFYELPMRLMPTDACKNIVNSLGVQNLPTAHLCLASMQIGALSATNSSSCAPCPAAVGSVLHLVRPGGNRCVLAIATPTGANCDAEAMYFTSLLDAQLVQFVEQQQQVL